MKIRESKGRFGDVTIIYVEDNDDHLYIVGRNVKRIQKLLEKYIGAKEQGNVIIERG